jgi:hypothetical protein
MVLIFRTNIEQKWMMERASQWLKAQPSIDRYAIDLSDEDSVLKVVAPANVTASLRAGLAAEGVELTLLALFEHSPD